MAELDYEVGSEQMQSYDPIPVARYEAMITESEVRTTAKGGKSLSIRWQITEGEHAGRLVFDNVNLVNDNPKAVEIGHKQLNSISAAVGYPAGTRIGDSAILHDRPCIIDVRIQSAGPDKQGIHREAKNIIKGYESIATATAPAAPTPPAASRPAPSPARQAAPAPAAAASGKPPWARK